MVTLAVRDGFMKFKLLIARNATKRIEITQITWRNGEPLVSTPPRITAAVAIEHAKPMLNADFLAALGLSREINIGKPAPNAAPGIRKMNASNITLVHASTILPTSAVRPGYHASSARSISTGFQTGGLYSPYIGMTDLNPDDGEVASRRLR